MVCLTSCYCSKNFGNNLNRIPTDELFEYFGTVFTHLIYVWKITNIFQKSYIAVTYFLHAVVFSQLHWNFQRRRLQDEIYFKKIFLIIIVITILKFFNNGSIL
ncbi:MAG: hypothetical protein LBK53_04185 [Heliobacteriaceae bacterium]|jgi:hypothetical protein|nr:hypothetical protein [Heliobacteriaceae bacterium]